MGDNRNSTREGQATGRWRVELLGPAQCKAPAGRRSDPSNTWPKKVKLLLLRGFEVRLKRHRGVLGGIRAHALLPVYAAVVFGSVLGPLPVSCPELAGDVAAIGSCTYLYLYFSTINSIYRTFAVPVLGAWWCVVALFTAPRRTRCSPRINTLPQVLLTFSYYLTLCLQCHARSEKICTERTGRARAK